MMAVILHPRRANSLAKPSRRSSVTISDNALPMKPMHRTQFDRELLAENVAPSACRNHGRQLLVLEDGSVLTALAWGGSSPSLRLWKNRDLIAEHFLPSQPSAPC